MNKSIETSNTDHSNNRNPLNLSKQREHSGIRAYRVFEDIKPGWDHDLHVHSNWSQDNLDGPTHRDFLQLAQRYKIHVGFADHYEIGFYTRTPPKSADLGPWKLNPKTIDSYLEFCDHLKEDYKNISIGLEVSYHDEISSEIDEFLDDYYSQFDYVIGSLHEVDLFKAITVPRDLEQTIKKHGGLHEVAELYFQYLEDMIRTKKFDIIGHPDVLFRFSHLQSSGIPMVIGSDSHLLDHFVAAVPKIREFNRLIRNEWKFVHKFSLD